MNSITAQELKQLLPSDEVFLLDVRTAPEHTQENIPNSINIPLMGLLNRANELPKDKKLIVYCQTGGRSLVACQYLQQIGFDNAYNLLGGIEAW